MYNNNYDQRSHHSKLFTYPNDDTNAQNIFVISNLDFPCSRIIFKKY